MQGRKHHYFLGAIKFNNESGVGVGTFDILRYALIEINFTLKISFQCQHTSPQDIISLNNKHRWEGNNKILTRAGIR